LLFFLSYFLLLCSEHFRYFSVFDLSLLVVVVVHDMVEWFHEESRDIVVEFIILCEIGDLPKVHAEFIVFLEKLLFIVIVAFLVFVPYQAGCSFLLVEDLVDFPGVVVVLRGGILLIELAVHFRECIVC